MERFHGPYERSYGGIPARSLTKAEGQRVVTGVTFSPVLSKGRLKDLPFHTRQEAELNGRTSGSAMIGTFWIEAKKLIVAHNLRVMMFPGFVVTLAR
jgi:hypothetical protein